MNIIARAAIAIYDGSASAPIFPARPDRPDEEAGAYVAQDVESATEGPFAHPPMFTPMCSKFSQHK